MTSAHFAMNVLATLETQVDSHNLQFFSFGQCEILLIVAHCVCMLSQYVRSCLLTHISRCIDEVDNRSLSNRSVLSG